MHLPWRDLNPAPSWQLPESHRDIHTSLTPDERDALATLAYGNDVLEIGSAYGFSTIAMALGGATSIVAVDPHTWCSPPTLQNMRDNLVAYGVEDRVTMIEDTFFNAVAQFKGDRRFDLVFIDGDHSYSTVKFDFQNAHNLLRPNAIIACHDYLELCCCDEVKTALDTLMPAGPTYTVDTMAVYEL